MKWDGYTSLPSLESKTVATAYTVGEETRYISHVRVIN